MNNKLAFAFFAEKKGLKTPKLFGYHFGPSFFSDTSMSKVDDTAGLRAYFEHLFNLGDTDRLFVKSVSDFGGKGCFILDRKKNLISQLKENKTALLSGRHLFFEVVQQHKDINAIHQNCINTLRIVSYIDDFGNIDFVSTFMRFGVDQSPVDNAASGGIYVGVNKDTGTLKELGFRSLYYGGGQFKCHPNSNFKFQDFKIPYLNKAYDMVTEFLVHLPDRFIEWDVAILEDGPTLIEGNHDPGLAISELAVGGLLKNESFRKFLKIVKEKY